MKVLPFRAGSNTPLPDRYAHELDEAIRTASRLLALTESLPTLCRATQGDPDREAVGAACEGFRWALEMFQSVLESAAAPGN